MSPCFVLILAVSPVLIFLIISRFFPEICLRCWQVLSLVRCYISLLFLLLYTVFQFLLLSSFLVFLFAVYFFYNIAEYISGLWVGFYEDPIGHFIWCYAISPFKFFNCSVHFLAYYWFMFHSWICILLLGVFHGCCYHPCRLLIFQCSRSCLVQIFKVCCYVFLSFLWVCYFLTFFCDGVVLYFVVSLACFFACHTRSKKAY